MHTLDDTEVSDSNDHTTTTRTGRTVKKPARSSIYSNTSDDGNIPINETFVVYLCAANLEFTIVHIDETTQLTWDYEDDLNLLGVLYARQVNERNSYIKLTLDLLDSTSGKKLKRIELDRKIRISKFDNPEFYLRLDADQCLISISRGSATSILAFRFISTNSV